MLWNGLDDQTLKINYLSIMWGTFCFKVTKYVDLVSKNSLQKRQTPHNILNGKTRNKFVVLISSTEYLDVLWNGLND